MEKSVEFIKRNYSPQTLAYLGDAYYETLAREYIIGEGDCRVSRLNEDIKRFVTAVSQSKIVDLIKDGLTEEEAEEYGCDQTSCFRLGGELIAMSNPWEEREDGEADFEIIEIDD